MTRIEGGAGPVGASMQPPSDSPTTTVKLGETKLSQVAERLGVDRDSLQQANPNISDSTALKVGQDVHLPQCQTPAVSVGDPGPKQTGSGTGAPINAGADAMNKSFVLERMGQSHLSQVQGGATTGTSTGGDKVSDKFLKDSHSPAGAELKRSWKEDLQQKVFEVTQDVTVNKAKTADKAYQKIDDYIRQ